MAKKNSQEITPDQSEKADVTRRSVSITEEPTPGEVTSPARKTRKKTVAADTTPAAVQPVLTSTPRKTRKKAEQTGAIESVPEVVKAAPTVPTPAVRKSRTTAAATEQTELTRPMPAKGKPAKKQEPVTIEAAPEPEEPVKKVKRGKWIALGIVGMLLIGVIGSAIGYWSAIQARKAEEVNQRLIVSTTQYELSLQDISNNNLSMAKRRLEYVIEVYPSYPGAADKLAEVMVQLAQQGQNQNVTVSIATPVPEATKDTRGAAAILQSAEQQLAAQDWSGLYTSVLSLRNIDPTYEAVKVDGLYYMALRNMGIANIKNGNLEVGIYQFTVAEKIGPIDAEAVNYRTLATYYVNGAACWNVLWSVAVQNFQYLYQSAPYLSDFNGVTATDRYAQSLEGYGDFLETTSDYCNAVTQYQTSIAVKASETVSAKYNQAVEYCKNPPATPTPTLNPEWTPTPTNAN